MPVRSHHLAEDAGEIAAAGRHFENLVARLDATGCNAFRRLAVRVAAVSAAGRPGSLTAAVTSLESPARRKARVARRSERPEQVMHSVRSFFPPGLSCQRTRTVISAHGIGTGTVGVIGRVKVANGKLPGIRVPRKAVIQGLANSFLVGDRQDFVTKPRIRPGKGGRLRFSRTWPQPGSPWSPPLPHPAR